MELREDHPAPPDKATSEQCQEHQTPRKRKNHNSSSSNKMMKKNKKRFTDEQIRRARLKSKQIEKDYIKLRDKYDNLASRFESLKDEKQSLVSQLEKLSEMVAEAHDGNRVGLEAEAEPILQQAAMEENDGFFALEQFMDMDEHRSFPVSPEKLHGFDSAADSRLQWLNSWT
ncbi:hypothetical protein F3Y22_tig00018834pilonHSYRG00002 [Hibiscus syriacus]|uniref:Homeobox-leucine zipper protein n=1 Tax=Hibiscus syriacus TaxID=106335 RepID=A0A6A3BVL6_HIBSY|nr:hypothetical protein F3Y22_tig00018834pilonHSYRG00002 [Hibiscus syriacus]